MYTVQCTLIHSTMYNFMYLSYTSVATHTRDTNNTNNYSDSEDG